MIRKGRHIAVRPDALIEARYDLTSSQNDIMDMVLSQIENDNNYSYELNINEYKKLYKSDTSNIYRDLKKAVKSMEGAGFYLINSTSKGIEKETFFVWFASIDYLETEGKIVVEVGQRLKGLLIEMKKRIYYKIEYPLNFNSVYSKRIYYYLKSFEDTGWRIDSLETLRNKLQCPSSYDKYGLFRTKALDMAHKEINNCSDLSFIFEEIKTGRKITAIKFIIKPKILQDTQKKEIEYKPTNTNEKCSRNENRVDINDIKKVFVEGITENEAEKILKVANNNLGIIKEKYEIAKQSSRIKNIVAWMIRAIKEDYKKPKEKTNQGSFNDFEQRSYDYEDLEKKLLGWENIKEKKK